MEKITLRDLAKMSGCSVSTVSKTLNGTDRVGKKTKEKIKKIAEQAGYRSSFSAQSLARKARKVSIILFKNPTEVRGLFEDGFSSAFEIYGEFGIEPEYFFYGTDKNDDMRSLDFDEIEEKSSGIIIVPNKGFEEIVEKINRISKKIPVVYLQTKPNQSAINRLCDITVDAKTVGKMSAQYLDVCEPSGKKIIITGYRDSWIHSENISGFSDYFGYEEPIVYECYDDMQTAYCVAKQAIDKIYPTGIFVTSYTSPAVCRAVSESGKKIDVVGVDLFGKSAECLEDGTLSAVIFQNQQMQAKKAIDAIVSYFRKSSIDDRPVKPEFILKSNIDCYNY